MKKIILLVLMISLFCFTSGCDDIKNLTDVTVKFTDTEPIPIVGVDGDTASVQVDLSNNSAYSKYDNILKDIEITSADFRVAQNIGDGATITLYAGDYSSTDFAQATQITEPFSFLGYETSTTWNNIVLQNKHYLENLLFNQRKFKLWAGISTTGTAAAELVIKLNIKLTVNPFKKI